MFEVKKDEDVLAIHFGLVYFMNSRLATYVEFNPLGCTMFCFYLRLDKQYHTFDLAFGWRHYLHAIHKWITWRNDE